MNVYVVVAVTTLVMTGYKGSKVLLSLMALSLGADPFTIGVLMSLYSVFPLLLAVPAGKAIDRLGFFVPLLCGTAGFGLGLAIPGLVPRMEALYVSAAVLGLSFVFFSVTAQSLVGALGTPQSRTRDFANFSLGPALGAFFGPLAVGFAIDHFGYASGYLMLSVVPLAGALTVAALRHRMPRPKKAGGSGGGSLDLWRDPQLRSTFLVSGVIITALELFTFYLPIYCHSVGLSASAIGMVMSAYAVSAFCVRIFLPGMSARLTEERVLTWALLLAGVTFALYPFFEHAVVLAGVSFLLGVGLGSCQPLAIILTYNRSPAGRVGEVLGMRVSVNKLSEFICPLFFGSLAAAFGMFPVFATNALLLLGGGWLNRRIRRQQ